MCCDFTGGWCGHMKDTNMKNNKKKCYFCKGAATRTTYWGAIGNRYEVSACVDCTQDAAKSDRHWAGLMRGFSEYARYYDNKGS